MSILTILFFWNHSLIKIDKREVNEYVQSGSLLVNHRHSLVDHNDIHVSAAVV